MKMKLILSSTDFRSEKSKQVILNQLEKPLLECRVLFCPNEMANKGALRSKKYRERLKSYGFSEENITVYNHYKPEEYTDLSPDVIYIGGGNTFGTMEHLRRGNFDKALVKYVKNGAVYIGGSAGAYVALKEFSHALKYDENAVGLTDFSGLGLYDGLILCHFSEERRGYFEELQKKDPNAISLTDEESLVVTDGKAVKY